MKPLENLDKYEVVLASNSPRRKQLLADLGIKFTTHVIDGIDESFPAGTPVMEVAQAISRGKAEAYRQLAATGSRLVITADTVVVCGGEVMGKPHDAAEAHAMLRRLSGRKHHVVTGVTLPRWNLPNLPTRRLIIMWIRLPRPTRPVPTAYRNG